MTIAKPAVSICIPTFNYAGFLPAAIDSALGQDFPDFEVVVVDNCSNDGTRSIVEAYSRQDQRVVFFENPRNLGMTANFNRAMEVARGKYIKFLCADDLLAKDCVSKMVEVLQAQPDVTLVGCGRAIFRGDLPATATAAYARRPFSRDGQQVIRECYFKGNLIGEPTAVMFRKSEILEPFDPHYDQALDMELWFRLLERGNFTFLADTLCAIREHDSRETVSNLRAGKITSDKIRLFKQYAQRPYLRGTVTERLNWDARMASSVARQVAAGAGPGAFAGIEGFYYPHLSSIVLIPLATVLTRIRHHSRQN